MADRRDKIGRFESGDMGELPPRPVVVETIPDHEGVGNVESDEVGLHRHLRPALLPQQHQRTNRGGPTVPEFCP